MTSVTGFLRAVYGLAVMLALAASGGGPTPVRATVMPSLVRTQLIECALVVRFEIDAKWHLYWQNPGDAGVAPSVTLELPPGWKQLGLRFPRPQILGSRSERSYGYETSLDVLVELKPPPLPLPNSIDVIATIKWMACKEACVVETNRISCTAATGVQPVPTPIRARSFATTLPAGFNATVTRKTSEGAATENLALEISALAATLAGRSALFIPEHCPGIEFVDGSGPFLLTHSDKESSARIAIALHPGDALGAPLRVRGLLLVGERDTDPAYEIDISPN